MRRFDESGGAFLQKYYRTLIGNFKGISKYYAPDAQLTISHESGESLVFHKDYAQVLQDAHKRSISHVYMSCLDRLNMGNAMLLNVVGEFQYVDGVMCRFVHTLVVSEFKVTNEVCRFLNEEVVFEEKKKIGNKVNFDGFVHCFKGGDLSKQKVVEMAGRVGRVVGVEKKNDEWCIEFVSQEDLKKFQNDENFKGFTRMVVEN